MVYEIADLLFWEQPPRAVGASFRKSNNHVPQENIISHTFINIFSSEVMKQIHTVCAEGTILGPQEVVHSI